MPRQSTTLSMPSVSIQRNDAKRQTTLWTLGTIQNVFLAISLGLDTVAFFYPHI